MHPAAQLFIVTIFQLRCTTSYWQQRHQLRFDLAYQLELVLLFLEAAAVCATFTDDGWNVFRPLAGDG
jgi:hypothetical protein